MRKGVHELKQLFKRRNRTHEFLDFSDIRQGVIELRSNRFANILEISALNFDLKSREEKEAILAGYREFLHSLSFPIQIVARSEILRLDSYLGNLEEREQLEDNRLIREQISGYRQFVRELIASRHILTRRYYLVLTYTAMTTKKVKGIDFWEEARHHLMDRKLTVETGLTRLGLSVDYLQDEEILQLLRKSYGVNIPMSLPVDQYVATQVVGR